MNSLYQHQLTNYNCITDIYLYFILKYGGWSIHYCQRYSIYLRCYIWISFYRRYNNVTGPSASLRARDFILFEISIVCIFILLAIFGYMTITLSDSFYIFLNILSTVFKLHKFSGLNNILYCWGGGNTVLRIVSWNVESKPYLFYIL